MNPDFLFQLIVFILSLQFIVDTALDYLNYRKYGAPVPHEVSDVFDEEQYRKSQLYQKTNFRFGLLTSGISFVVTIAFLLLGGFAWLNELAASVSTSPIPKALLFFGILGLGSDLLGTPFSYYHTFVIEERFGFNKSTPSIFWTDKVKGWLLAGILGTVLLSAILYFYDWAGADFWWYAWILISAFTVIINLFYSRIIVPLFNKQQPLEDGALRQAIESYAKQVNFGLTQIFVIDGSRRSSKANAYFSGFGNQRRVTLYDTLIKDLDTEEVVAVLAHEVGHYKRNHILINLFSSLILTGFTLFLLGIFVNHPELSLALGVQEPEFHIALLSFGLLYSPISEITGLVMHYLSRRFEYQADNYARQTYSGEPLVTALKKLSRNHLSNLTPHPAYVFMHYSHPPLKDRIRNLISG
jgi:STE24 endopeptidase